MIQGIIGVVIGLAFFMIGFGKARVSKNPEANAAFVKKWGLFFKIAGPIIALVGIGMLLSNL